MHGIEFLSINQYYSSQERADETRPESVKRPAKNVRIRGKPDEVHCS
jgi:hypothetical protein